VTAADDVTPTSGTHGSTRYVVAITTLVHVRRIIQKGWCESGLRKPVLLAQARMLQLRMARIAGAIDRSGFTIRISDSPIGSKPFEIEDSSQHSARHECE